jgi:hypothetical protein
MVQAEMIIKTKNRIGAEQFYLGHFGMEALQQSTIPDINNRPNNYLESITLRIDNGNQMINDRRKAKDNATKKCESPAKTSTKGTPTQKRKKLKRSPTNDCAKDSSTSSSPSSTSSSSEDDDDKDNDTDKEPGNTTDDNDNDDNDNDDDNDDNDDKSDNGNDNDNDKDNNSGFMSQDLYDPEDNRIANV